MTVLPAIDAQVSEFSKQAARHIWRRLREWNIAGPVPLAAEARVLDYLAAEVEWAVAGVSSDLVQEFLDEVRILEEEAARLGEIPDCAAYWDHRLSQEVSTFMQLDKLLGHEDDGQD